MAYRVFMRSEVYGMETFDEHEELSTAFESVGRLVKAAEKEADGVERMIGVLVNYEEDEGADEDEE